MKPCRSERWGRSSAPQSPVERVHAVAYGGISLAEDVFSNPWQPPGRKRERPTLSPCWMNSIQPRCSAQTNSAHALPIAITGRKWKNPTEQTSRPMFPRETG